jgi:glycosyltransferase involved in cell wall biosynthesis
VSTIETKNKRVLLISQHFYPEIGSAANRMKNIYIELRELGYKVDVLTLVPRYPNQEMYKDEKYWNEPVNEDDVIRIDPSIKNHNGSMIKRLFLYLQVMLGFIMEILRLPKHYDVIFVTSPPIFVGAAGLIAKWKLKTKFILDIRDLWPESLIGVGVLNNKLILKGSYAFEKFLYKQADKIVVNSKSFITYMSSKGVNPQKITFIPNSLTEEELMFNPIELKEQNQEKISVLYTGNLGLAQDLNKLLAVAEQMKNVKNVQFKILGYGKNVEQVNEYIEQKNLLNVELLSARNRKDTLLQIQQADIAYVSLVESDVFKTVLPGKIIDYMCMKKPIIADVSGYAEEIIKSADCGFVLNQNSNEEMIEIIDTLKDQPMLREKLGEQGYQYAFNNLRWKTNITKLVTLMEGLND